MHDSLTTALNLESGQRSASAAQQNQDNEVSIANVLFSQNRLRPGATLNAYGAPEPIIGQPPVGGSVPVVQRSTGQFMWAHPPQFPPPQPPAAGSQAAPSAPWGPGSATADIPAQFRPPARVNEEGGGGSSAVRVVSSPKSKGSKDSKGSSPKGDRGVKRNFDDLAAGEAVLSLPRYSHVSMLINAALISLPKLLRFFDLMHTATRDSEQSVFEGGQIPVEIDLPEFYHFHTTYTCPISRSQTSDENAPMLLVCGHTISRRCLDRITRSSRGRTIKCPMCPQHQTVSQSKQLYF